MSTNNPATKLDRNIRADTQRAKDFFGALQKDIDGDTNDRWNWIVKLDRFRRRRYCLEWRDPVDPWPGSSEIVMPLIDKKLDELKPAYLNLLTQVNPPITALAMKPENMEKTSRVEAWFEHGINYGFPRFLEEMTLCIDDVLETGRMIGKSAWRYDTRISAEKIDYGKLPFRLRQMAVRAESEQEAQVKQEALKQQGIDGVVLTKSDFDEMHDEIAMVVAVEFGLQDDPTDKKAHADIMRWLRSGARDPLYTEKRDVHRSTPYLKNVSPESLIIPVGTTQYIEDAPRIAEVMYFTEPGFIQAAIDCGWDQSVAKEIIKRKAQGRTYKHPVDQNATTTRYSVNVAAYEKMYPVVEAYTYYTNDPFGRERKIVIVYSPLMPETPLKWTVYYSASGRWPYSTAVFERNENDWYAPRGVPEKLDDLDKEITYQHRARLNAAEVTLNPSFFYRPDPTLNTDNVRWRPGAFFPSRDPSQIVQTRFESRMMEFMQEEASLKTWAEEYLGGADFGLTGSLSNTSEPRTATEIQAIRTKQSLAISYRGTEFKRFIAEVAHNLFDLFIEKGDDVSWIRTTASEPIRLTKEELQGGYTFQLTGTMGEEDPIYSEGKSLARLQMLMQIQQLGGLQTHEINIGQAVEDWLVSHDIRAKDRLIRRRSAEEMQQLQQEQQAQAEVDQNQPTDLNSLEARLKGARKAAPHGGEQQVRL